MEYTGITEWKGLKLRERNKVQDINIDEIRVYTINGTALSGPHNIEDTSYYKCLCGDITSYDNYFDMCHPFGTEKVKHIMDSKEFLELADNFNYLEGNHKEDYIGVKRMNDGYETLDGEHRLAILKKQGKETVKALVLDKRWMS